MKWRMKTASGRSVRWPSPQSLRSRRSLRVRFGNHPCGFWKLRKQHLFRQAVHLIIDHLVTGGLPARFAKFATRIDTQRSLSVAIGRSKSKGEKEFRTLCPHTRSWISEDGQDAYR